ncbi:MAG: M20/M25/M40 family metallo-hydrolase [Patescibacteria group bacterium]
MLRENTLERKRLEPGRALKSSQTIWESRNVALLETYIGIPNKSPHFDPDWEKNGHMGRAVDLYRKWAEDRKEAIPGLSVEVLQIPGKTPLIYIEIPGTLPEKEADSKNILLYGHLDKQPEFTGWKEGLEPWKPVRRGDRLYGRGGADDGYAMPAALTAYELLAEQGVPYSRASLIIEASEESGSPDLPEYLELIAPRIGTPDMVICLDSGAGDYKRLWNTTSLRGLVAGTLEVKVLENGVHSGAGSGVGGDPHRIAASLLSRIENLETGEVTLPALHTTIPPERIEEAKQTAELLGDEIASSLPFLEGVESMHGDPAELLLNRTWRPAITVIGVDGLPSIEKAGNTLAPGVDWKLSTRIPAGVNAKEAALAMKEVLEKDPPHNAKVTFNAEGSEGWNAPKSKPWLEDSLRSASENYFGNPSAGQGEGGSIPFMKMLGDKFPEAQFLVTGVLGPESNAHGPNEFLEIEFVKKLNAAVAQVIADHAAA